jgi:spore coat protein U-like protein
MRNKKICKLMAIAYVLSIACIPCARATGSSTANPQATATIASVCTINAQNLSFGNLVLPLSAQSASSNMSVLCSNKASYTVALAYGGIYGQGSNTSGDYWVYNGGHQYREYNSSGTVVGIVTCNNNTATLVYSPTITTCASGVPTGWSGAYNASGNQYIGAAYTYGEMTGVVNGDHIGYFIQVPNNPGQVWNAGNYSYSATGIGSIQTIPVVGTLVPAQSSGSYPTPDMYMDTVTATVNF